MIGQKRMRGRKLIALKIVTKCPYFSTNFNDEHPPTTNFYYLYIYMYIHSQKGLYKLLYGTPW